MCGNCYDNVAVIIETRDGCIRRSKVLNTDDPRTLTIGNLLDMATSRLICPTSIRQRSTQSHKDIAVVYGQRPRLILVDGFVD